MNLKKSDGKFDAPPAKGEEQGEEKGPGEEQEAADKKEEQTQAEEADADDADSEEDMSEKAQLTGGDLEKSLEALETIISGDDAVSRKTELLSKAQEGDLADDEKTELFGLLGKSDTADTAGQLGDELRKGFEENDEIVQAIDVSAYLREQSEELAKSLDILAGHVESSDKRQHDFNLVLAGAVSQTGKLVKSMADRLGVIESQPARAPKSQGVTGAQPLVKSFAGNTPEEGAEPTPEMGELSKSEVIDTLQNMLEKSVDENRGASAECGVDLGIAIAQYDQTMEMAPDLVTEMQKFRAAR